MLTRAPIPEGASRRSLALKAALLLASLALLLGACQDDRPFNTGWESFAADRRERLVINQPFDALAIRLQERLQVAGMDRLKAAARREPSLFTVDSRQVLITHLWLVGPENLSPFARFFACPDGRPVAAAAGTLFVMELRQGTEIEFHLGFAATDEPTAPDACTLRPGLLAALAGWAGIT
jgi:hypothetical protein